MKVRELISTLKTYDPELEVFVGYEGIAVEAGGVLSILNPRVGVCIDDKDDWEVEQ
jgi:hypothetical protein